MKICLVSDYLIGYHQTWSGAEMVCLRFSKILRKENQELIFLTAKLKGKDPGPGVFTVPKVNLKNQFLRQVLVPFYLILDIFFVLYYFKKNKPDIIHLLHSNYLFIPVMLGAKILGLPAVFTVLDYFIICPSAGLRLENGELCRKPEGFHCLKCISFPEFLKRIIIKKLSKNLNGLITFTQTSRNRLVRHGIPSHKIKVIYTYHLPLRFVKEIKEKSIRINSNSFLFIGSFHPHKGLRILIRSLPEVFKKFPQAKLIIVGRGNKNDEKEIKEMIIDLGLKNYVKFLGQKNNKESLELVFKSEFVVVPEQWFSDFGPLILVEAMILGKPVIASRLGGISEFVKDGINGFLVSYNQPEQFAEKIIWLLENKSSARAMGERAREDGEFLLKPDYGKEVINFYESLI